MTTVRERLKMTKAETLAYDAGYVDGFDGNPQDPVLRQALNAAGWAYLKGLRDGMRQRNTPTGDER